MIQRIFFTFEFSLFCYCLFNSGFSLEKAFTDFITYNIKLIGELKDLMLHLIGG